MPFTRTSGPHSSASTRINWLIPALAAQACAWSAEALTACPAVIAISDAPGRLSRSWQPRNTLQVTWRSDRKSVVEGKRVSERVALGVRGIVKKQTTKQNMKETKT